MKLPRSAYNLLTFIGAALAVLSLLFIAFLFVVSILYRSEDQYIGLFIYIFFPGLMLLGLTIIPIGMLIQRRKDRKSISTIPKLPYIDLNDKKHRNAALIFVISTIFIVFISGMGSYRTFHYTESVEFCGTLCHNVMEPEFVAYQNSPHARVKCVECHVGEGASWYMRSKLSGMYQVYSVLFNKFSRPIETPLHNLRPARETCEKCHWPQKFYARKLRVQKTFMTDKENSEWDIMMQMKVGPMYSAQGLQEGIHWHINPNTKIEYMASKSNKEEIPWVKYTNLTTGVVQIFMDQDKPLSDSLQKKLAPQKMDCIDCHNRPSHNYRAPTSYVNNEIIAGRISKSIPFIKKIAMEVLKTPFGTKDSAMMAIRSGIIRFYVKEHGEFYAKNKELIYQAIVAIQNAYSKNAFPEMRVAYDKYPSHIGHMESTGCFRCHDDKHKTATGKTISKDCNLCHTIVAQGTVKNLEKVSIIDTLQFKHPTDIDNAWKETNCSECHTYLFQ